MNTACHFLGRLYDGVLKAAAFYAYFPWIVVGR